MTVAWREIPLIHEDRERLATMGWRKVTLGQAISIAQAWNAGLSSPQIAAHLGTRLGAVTCSIGVMRKADIALRAANDSSPEPVPFRRSWTPDGVEWRSAEMVRIVHTHIARLERLAVHDPAAARALSYYKRGVSA